jgi:hypothetical protein
MTAPVKRGRRGPRRALTEDEILDAALNVMKPGASPRCTLAGAGPA